MKTLEPIARLVKVQNAGKPTNIIIHHYPTWADADTFPVAFTRTLGDGFPRFFMIPGMNHCRGGPEADMIDYRSCLEEWVEKEKAPDMMVGKHIEGGVAKFTRPVFPDRATSMMRPIGSPDCFQVREG